MITLYLKETNVDEVSMCPPASSQDKLYEGELEVTPATEKQILQTSGTVVPEDIIVNAIPFYEQENEAGGKTVYIG